MTNPDGMLHPELLAADEPHAILRDGRRLGRVTEAAALSAGTTAARRQGPRQPPDRPG